MYAFKEIHLTVHLTIFQFRSHRGCSSKYWQIRLFPGSYMHYVFITYQKEVDATCYLS